MKEEQGGPPGSEVLERAPEEGTFWQSPEGDEEPDRCRGVVLGRAEGWRKGPLWPPVMFGMVGGKVQGSELWRGGRPGGMPVQGQGLVLTEVEEHLPRLGGA